MPKSLDRCVMEVMKDGHDEKGAWAICRSSMDMSESKAMDDVIIHAKKISAEIKSGKRKYDLPETFDIPGIPIFASGKWNGESYTEKDLEDMISAFEETKGFMKPYLKLGHDHNQKLVQKDGLPAAGWIDRLYKIGKTLYADFSRVPKKIYDLIKAGAYKKISSEIWWNFDFNGKVYRRMLKAASFLGSDWPGVSTLDDIISLYASVGEAKAFEGKGDLKTLEADKGDIAAKEETMEWEKKYAEAAQKLAEAEVKLKELSSKEERVAALETELKKAKEDLGNSSKKVAELEGNISEFSRKARETEVNALLDKAIEDKKIVPSQRAALFTLLMNMDDEKKYKVNDKEKGASELLKEFIASNSVDVNTEGETEAGKAQRDKENSSLLEKAKSYSEKNKVSLREAMIAVSPETKAE